MQEFDIPATQIDQWQYQREGATGFLCDAPKAEPAPVIDGKTLHAKIGALTPENDFCPARSERPTYRLAQKMIIPPPA